MKKLLSLFMVLALLIAMVPASLAAEGFTISDYKITLEGKKIYGRLFMPEGEGPFPLIIMCHGLNSSQSTFSATAKKYAAAGYACYTFDFCGGGLNCKSSGKSTKMSVETEKQDLFDVMDVIKQEPWVDTEQLFLLGGSLGGLVATLALAERGDEFKAAILHFPALCLPDNTRATYASVDEIPRTVKFDGFPLGSIFYSTLYDIQMPEVVAACNTPVCIVHGDADTLVPLESVSEIYTHFPSYELTVLPGQGHGFRGDMKEQCDQLCLDFLNRYTGLSE